MFFKSTLATVVALNSHLFAVMLKHHLLGEHFRSPLSHISTLVIPLTYPHTT